MRLFEISLIKVPFKYLNNTLESSREERVSPHTRRFNCFLLFYSRESALLKIMIVLILTTCLLDIVLIYKEKLVVDGKGAVRG